MTIIILLMAAAALDAAAPTADASICSRKADALMRVLEMAKFAKEPEGTIRSVFDQATNAQVNCSQNESLTYLRLRSAELGKGAFVGDLTQSSRAELLQLANEASLRFPGSARILTVDARATGSLDVAKRAVAADGRYVPAKVALAAALVAGGEAASAVKTLDALPGLDTTSDGFVILARARLATNDLVGAARAAQQELTQRQIDLVEPDVGNPWPAIEAHEVAAFAALGLKRYDEAARHFVAANFGSPKVRAILDHPPPPLRRALQKLPHRRVP